MMVLTMKVDRVDATTGMSTMKYETTMMKTKAAWKGEAI